jgi:hypothetical protein
MTTLLEDLAINGETVDGETVAAELSSSKPNTVDADADADAADDTSSDTSCEVCRVMSGEGEDDWFADETGRKWAGIAEELVGTNRIIFSLKIKTTGTVGLFKETEDLSTGAEGGMRVSLSADGVAYVLDDGELRFQDGHEFSHFVQTFLREDEPWDIRRIRLHDLSKEISTLEDSIRTEVARQKQKETTNKDAHSPAGQNRDSVETVDPESDSVAIEELLDKHAEKIDERQMRLAWEVMVPWSSNHKSDESGMAGTILNHFYNVGKQGRINQRSTLKQWLGPNPEDLIPATTTYTPNSPSSPSSPGSEGKTPSVLLECPKVGDRGGVTFRADPSHILDLATMWLTASARSLRDAADQVITEEAESGRKMEVDIAIDPASIRDVLLPFVIPGEREAVQLWNPEPPLKNVFATDASTASNQSGS